MTMTLSEVNGPALLAGLQRAASVFSTKDVSRQGEVMTAHGTRSSETNYDTTIGRYLSENRGSLGIESTGQRTTRGERWRKTKGASRALPEEIARRIDEIMARATGKKS